MERFEKQFASRDAARHDQGFEFELIDIEEARRILDNETVTHFHVAAPALPPEHWKARRQPPSPSDRNLTGQALDWLAAVPLELRPYNLTQQYPRIVNALAEVWQNRSRRDVAFYGLLIDGRSGRKGFPALVHDELVALRDWKPDTPIA